MGPARLAVRDLARVAEFYRDVLGLAVLQQTEDRVTLGADEPLIVLESAPDAPARPPRTTGLFHAALLLPTRADLGRFLVHAHARWPLEGASDHVVSEAIYLSDPEGNGLEVYADRPRETWRWDGDRLEMATLPMDLAAVARAGADVPWGGAPVGTRMGHIHLQVRDAAEAGRFYEDVIGFAPTTRYPGAAFLSAGRYHHHLAANEWAGRGAPKPPERSLGLRAFTILAPTVEAVDALASRVERAGALVHQEERACRFRDPSGIEGVARAVE